MKTLLRELRVMALLAAALTWCAVLIMVRTLWTRSFDYGFLVWNLGLASAPMLFSTLTILQTRLVLRLVFGFLWLLFLPNAPYIFTDFLHLRTLDSGAMLLDVLMVSSCAATGLALGYCSMMQIHRLFDAAGRKVLGWIMAFISMFLCGLGIYLGRVLRWHSVDVFRNPSILLRDIAEHALNPFGHYQDWAIILGFGLLLSLGYALFIINAGQSPALTDSPASPLMNSAVTEEEPPSASLQNHAHLAVRWPMRARVQDSLTGSRWFWQEVVEVGGVGEFFGRTGGVASEARGSGQEWRAFARIPAVAAETGRFLASFQNTGRKRRVLWRGRRTSDGGSRILVRNSIVSASLWQDCPEMSVYPLDTCLRLRQFNFRLRGYGGQLASGVHFEGRFWGIWKKIHAGE